MPSQNRSSRILLAVDARDLVRYESVTFPRRTGNKGKAATCIQVFPLLILQGKASSTHG